MVVVAVIVDIDLPVVVGVDWVASSTSDSFLFPFARCYPHKWSGKRGWDKGVGTRGREEWKGVGSRKGLGWKGVGNGRGWRMEGGREWKGVGNKRRRIKGVVNERGWGV